ncbi:MAG: alginate export family protein [Phycisphaerae bacterium]
MRRDLWMVPVGLLLGAALLLVAPAGATAQQTDAEEAGCDRLSTWAGPFASAEQFGEWIDGIKHPAPWLELYGDIRLREIFAPNLLLDQTDRHFQRYRFRVGAKVSPLEDIDFNVRLVYEPRHYCQPDDFEVWQMSEAIIDKLNVEWRNFLGMPLTITAGRQDIILGDGWLVLDGTPLDGSRTIFFDAIRGTLDMPDLQSKLDVIYVCNSADSDRLSPACDKDFHNHEQDEQGAIVYLTNNSMEDTQVDGYFIYKHDEAVLGNGTTGDIYTFGGRMVRKLDENWRYNAQGAYQFGNKDGRDLCAFGFKGGVSYWMNDDWNNNFRVNYEYLSGDRHEPGSSRTTQFDPLWGRWPQFSELYVYPIALENRPGEISNLHRINIGWSFNPVERMEICADYHVLFADQNQVGLANPNISNDGYCRGQLVSGLLKYKFNDYVSTHLLGELFFPGDYYTDIRNEVAGFFRYEIMFTW